MFKIMKKKLFFLNLYLTNNIFNIFYIKINRKL